MSSIKQSEIKAAVALTAATPDPAFEKIVNKAIDKDNSLLDEVVSFTTFVEQGKYGYDLFVEDDDEDKFTARLTRLAKTVAATKSYTVEKSYSGTIWIVVGQGKAPAGFKHGVDVRD